MKVAAYKAALSIPPPPALRCPCSGFHCAPPPSALRLCPRQVGFTYSLSGEKEQKISCHYVDVVAEVVVIVRVVVAVVYVVVVVARVSVVTAHVEVVVVAAVVASFHLYLSFFSRAFFIYCYLI